MATLSKFNIAEVDTTARFQAFVATISDSLAALGWVQSTDTGQIDAATVTGPAVSTYAGYQMWRMNDSLQSTAPFFLKLRFGRGSGALPNLAISVGNKTNGAGVFQGLSQGDEVISSWSTNTSLATYQSMFSGSTNRIAAILGVNAASPWTTLFSAERSKNTDGTDSADGLIFVWQSASASAGRLQYITTAQGAAFTGATRNPVAVLPTGTSGAFNGNIPVSPLYPVPGRVLPPGLNHIAYCNTDITQWAILPVNIYGTDHAYIALGNSNIDNVTAHSVAMRWE